MDERDISDLAEALISEPIEDSGSDTASRYNFQYLCAARHCFALLTDPRLTGIVCEWHVDYVLLYSDGTNELVSVKHREPKVGPWPFTELWSKGVLTTLYQRWKEVAGAKCRLVTNGSMKAGRDSALEFATDLTNRRVEKYAADVADKLECSEGEAKKFLLALRIEYGIPDRVALRSHQIVHTVSTALESADITDITSPDAWDAVVNLVASKSRDLDNRDFSSIDLASPSALDAGDLTSAKIARRTIRRSDIVKALSSPASYTDGEYPLASNLWMREPSATFVGRDNILQEMEEYCQEESRSNPAVALLGMSGVGKSELLAQYAWKHAQQYKFVWWVRADSWNSLAADLTALADRIGLPMSDSDDELRQLKQYFLHNRGLILLDGAATDPKIVKFIPNISSTRFLVSSLDQTWVTHMPAINVTPLADADANALLASVLTEVNYKELVVLNQALKGLPLALKQAAGYISVSGIPIEAYSEMVHDRASELLRRAAPPEHVGLTAALSITLDRLQKDHPHALGLLHILSFLAPHGFPTDLFGVEIPLRDDRELASEAPPAGAVEVEQLAAAELESLSDKTVQLLSDLKDHLALFDAVADLQRYSLIEAQRGGVTCHALTQAVVRHTLGGPEKQSAINAGTFLLNKVANLSPFDSRYWPHYRHMMPHFEAIIEYQVNRRSLPCNVLFFYSVISLSLGVYGAKEASLSYAEKAVAACDDLGEMSGDTIVFTRLLLVEALTRTDQWEEALRVTSECFALDGYGELDPYSVGTLHTKRAAVLHLQGNLKQAIVELGIAHDYIDSGLNPKKASSLQRAVKANKATLRREIGDAEGAITEFKELISDYPEDASRNGLATLYSNLCLSYLDATKFEKALSASKKALDIDLETLDGFHADAARDWNNAGLALLELEKADVAITAFETSLRIHERISRSPSTVYFVSRMNLGRAQMAQRSFTAARETLENTLKGQESLIGPKHRDVAATLANLSVVYTALHLFGDAASAAYRAIKIDTEVYGDGHPELMPDYNNMAGALMFSEQYRAALKWLNKAHSIAVRCFGNGNIRVGMCLEKIALCEYGSGQLKEGVTAMREAVGIFESKLGTQHPETRSCRSLLAQMLEGKSRLDLSDL